MGRSHSLNSKLPVKLASLVGNTFNVNLNFFKSVRLVLDAKSALRVIAVQLLIGPRDSCYRIAYHNNLLRIIDLQSGTMHVIDPNKVRLVQLNLHTKEHISTGSKVYKLP